MIDEATERAALTARLKTIATREGLKVRDPDGLTSAIEQSGVSAWFHGTLDDAAIADRLHTLNSKRRELFEAPTDAAANGPADEAFRKWLGPSRVAQWSNLNATTRLGLHHQWKSGEAPKPAVGDELVARYGTAEKALERMTPVEKLRFAHSIGASTKTSHPATTPHTPALQGLTGAPKLAALDVQREAQRLTTEIAGLRNSKGGGFNVQMARDSAIRAAETKLERLRERWGALVP